MTAPVRHPLNARLWVLATSALVLGALLSTPHAVAETAPKILKKVPPEFPEDAGKVASGVVKAKVSIDDEGKVTDVAILEADPKTVFDRAAKKALMRWRFEPSGAAQSYEVKLIFRSDD